MTPNSAYTLTPIVAATNYAPATATESPIYALHCTATNSGNTTIVTLGDPLTTITFPAGSLVVGQVYYIYVKEVTSLGGGSFIGYRWAGRPITW